MSMRYLGEQLDIHGGGHDVLFPHHENEIAQSEAYTGKTPFVRYWMHNGLLGLGEDEEKMTRHLGNVISVQEALEKYSADAIRLFLLSSHYRSSPTWSDTSVRAAERGAERLRVALRDFPGSAEADPGGALSDVAEAARRQFIRFMDDDFNTPQGIAQVFDLARAINQGRDSDTAPESLAYAQSVLEELTEVLGLTMKGLAGPTETEPFISLLVQVRAQLREAKQWALADRIREGLVELGVVLEDDPEGTTWKYTT